MKEKCKKRNFIFLVMRHTSDIVRCASRSLKKHLICSGQMDLIVYALIYPIDEKKTVKQWDSLVLTLG